MSSPQVPEIDPNEKPLSLGRILGSCAIVAMLLAAEVSGEILIEQYVSKGSAWRIILGIAIYITVPFLFWLLLELLRGGALTLANTIWQALNVAAVALIAYFVLNEGATFMQWIGVGLAISSVIIMIIPEILGWKGAHYRGYKNKRLS